MDFEVKEKIRQFAEPVVTSEGMELIHVECMKMHTRWIIRLFLDKEGGITLADCANVSDQLGDIFDIREVVNGPYTLEVSSPGFDRPISRDVDFLKYRSSKVNIKTVVKVEGVKNFHGILVDSIEEAGRKFVVVDVSGKIYRIPRQDILKANLADVG
ncbi:MAG: ribosome maturation factor RimP [Smithella sp.]